MKYKLYRYLVNAEKNEFVEYLTDGGSKGWVRNVVRYLTPDEFDYQYHPMMKWTKGYMIRVHLANNFVKELTEQEVFIELL